MPLAELAALGAALTWAIGGIISVGPSRKLGAIRFNRLRMTLVFVMLFSATLLINRWQTIEYSHITPLILSGFIGIFVGDTALFSTLRCLGPRRTAIIFATNAPIGAFMGYLLLGEHLALKALIGSVFVFAGVVLAIVYGKRREQVHQWEDIHGTLATGIVTGLIAATCQAAGAIIAKPVMEAGVDPIAASTVRVGVAALSLFAIFFFQNSRNRNLAPVTAKLVGQVAASGFIGMGIGMTLILYGLRYGNTGIILMLSATTPIMILPVLWIITKERPALGAFLGAILAVFGTGLILSG